MSQHRKKAARTSSDAVSIVDIDKERADKLRKLSEEVERWTETHDASDLVNELAEKWEIDSVYAELAHFPRTAFKILAPRLQHRDIDMDDPNSYGLREVEEAIVREEQYAIAALGKVKLSPPGDERTQLLRRVNTVLQMVFHARRMVVSAFQARVAVHESLGHAVELSEELDMLLGSWQMRFRWCDLSKCTPGQKLLMYVLDLAMEKGYRKIGNQVYEPIVTPENYETHAWRAVGEIEAFVWNSAKKELNCEQWMNLTSSGTVAEAVSKYLRNAQDPQFPTLVKDRSVFSFRNGVYVARDDAFHPYGNRGTGLPRSLAAAKFFDMPFDDHADTEDWRDIPTPSMSVIMEYQDWPPEVCDWAYAFFGRLLYNVGDKDGWQIIPFLHGAAGAGKSTLIEHVAKRFYDPADVGTMGNNIERQFGLWPLYDKFIFVGPEIKSDFRIEQAELQSVVSGEGLQIAGKHIKAFTVDRWTATGILAGNEVPGFKDNQGSMQRRLMVFRFLKAVQNGDSRLGEKLATEMPAILLKCNRAYLEVARRYGGCNIWPVLPSYFRETRNEMAQTLSAIEAFMNSSEVVRDPALFCPYDEFRTAYKTFCIQNNYAIEGRLGINTFRSAFANYGLATVKEERTYRGVSRRTDWVVGMDVAQDAAASLLG